jgi:hypothetical protein
VEEQAASGGADPVSAIANASGQLFDVIGKGIDAFSFKSKAYYERLNAAGVPKFNDFFADGKIDKTGQNMTTIYVLAFILTIVVVAFAMGNKENSN